MKKLLSALLLPLAWLVNRLGSPLQRLWSHARTRGLIHHPVDVSNVILGTPEVHGTGNIHLGKSLYLYPALYWETQGDGKIEIGDDVVMSRGVHLVAYSQITLEQGVMIGEYTSLRDANHRIVPGRSVRHTGHEASPIHIARNAWIGRGVTILGGVTIGEGAIVGANAVVTRDVAAGSIVVGAPARPIANKEAGTAPRGK